MTHHCRGDCPPVEEQQLAFEDVTEMEPVQGDPEYTAWLKAGRPKIEPSTRVGEWATD